jgi:hypothetical protein
MGIASRFRRAWRVLRSSQNQNLADYAARIQRTLNATYDAARTSDDLAAYWANADGFDADSANSRGVRETLTRRSRYETANNGFSDGIASTYSTDLVGTGPQLRMQTNSPAFNQMVERTWFLWCQAVSFRRKLWCMAHAKHVDGEAIGVLRRNHGINHPIKLDVVLYETEQCQTPFLPFGEPGRIDGIEFDKFGNPISYDILNQHPGSANNFAIDQIPERVPASLVLHWFKMRRPGQHRGVPECASTLNLGACFRRGRISTLLTWEKIAKWTLFLKTLFEPEEIQGIPPFSSFDVSDGMVTNLPNSVEPLQLKAEHPGPTYEAAHKLWLNEQGRPKAMPLNKVMCNSADYNYASGRLDFQTYYSELDVDREDGNDVLDKCFNVWLDWAILTFRWLGGIPEAVGPGARFHTWDWPKHRVADVEAEANANRTKLESGQIFPHRLFSDQGLDWEDECEAGAQSLGMTVDEFKRRIADVLYPPPKAEPKPSPAPTDAAVAQAMRSLSRRGLVPASVNGNGVHHGN